MLEFLKLLFRPWKYIGLRAKLGGCSSLLMLIASATMLVTDQHWVWIFFWTAFVIFIPTMLINLILDMRLSRQASKMFDDLMDAHNDYIIRTGDLSVLPPQVQEQIKINYADKKLKEGGPQ